MKWLLLILLISCGKEQTPSRQDLEDYDGDLTKNEFEKTEIDKYIAEVKPLPELRGFLRVDKIDIPFSSHQNLKEESLKYLTLNEKMIKPETYFSEFSFLRLMPKGIPTPTLHSSQDVELIFETEISQPLYLFLKKDNDKRKIRELQKSIRLTLSKGDLEDILKGRSHFAIKPLENPTSDIERKTYRVHFYDGHKGKIYYVSKSLDYSRFLSSLNIKPKNVGSLLMENHNSEVWEWWTRELPQGDKALVFETHKGLRRSYLKGFVKGSKNVLRDNGTTTVSLNIPKHPDAKIHLRIRAERFERTFKEHSKKDYFGGGGGGGREGNGSVPIRCRRTYRKVDRSFSVPINGNTLLTNLDIKGDGKNLKFNFAERIDQNGKYWEVGIVHAGKNVTVGLKKLPENTFQEIGLIKTNCSREKPSTQPSNIEGKFYLEIETFIENLD